MMDKGILFREEDSVAGYLGVHIDWKEDNTIVLTQSGLAEKIINVLYLTDDTIFFVDTPCTKFLAIDKDGKPEHSDFEYHLIVGQLNYLQEIYN